MLTKGLALSDRYRLSERVATGGMGTVWRCVDTLLDREVAVKILLPTLVEDPEFTTRFHAEARMLAALRHPGIVAVHDFGSTTLTDGNRVSYLVMEYVDGEPLNAWIRRAGRLDPASTMSAVAQAATALHIAHTAGIVHRDVKPGNLLAKRDGTIVLVDFGIARSAASSGLTASHMVLGSASYMSPEQVNNQPVSPATDVYALGAVAYHCLTGQPPFVGATLLQVALQHAQDAPPPLPHDIPPPVAAVVERALAKNPADRWPSAAAMADAARAATPTVRPVLPGPRPAGDALAPPPPWPVPTGDKAAPASAASTGGGATTPPAAPAGDRPAALTGDGPGAAPAAPTGDRPAEPTNDRQPAPPAAGRPVTPPGRGGVPGRSPKPKSPDGGRAPRRRMVLACVAGAAAAVLVGVGVILALPPDGPRQGTPEPTAGSLGAVGAVSAPPGPDTDGARNGRPEPGTGVPAGWSTPAGAGVVPNGTTGAGTGAEPGGPPGPKPGDRPVPEPGASASSNAPPPASPPANPPRSNPHTPEELCGEGFQVVESAALVADGVRTGRVYLLRKPPARVKCVVTLKEIALGEPTAVSAFLEVQGKKRTTAGGSSEYYAGPVRVGGGKACVAWGGSTGGASYGSDFEHCG
ncbi:serine/threonine-protein kinase [Micromonospora sp. KC606]|uniref:protein kinase domain-containing protein n=1 Tax=Micromonospora sp. KC606 TaxID=2530379 RepID=UPI001A9E2CC1